MSNDAWNRLFAALLSLTLTAGLAVGQLELPSILSDGMVLRRGAAVSLFGVAGPNVPVTIQPSWQTDAVTTTSGPDGRFAATVTTPASGGPFEITFSTDSARRVVRDVAIGEVWLGSGQSNMEMPVGDHGGGYRGVKDMQAELEAAKVPGIRLFTVTNAVSGEPSRICQGRWVKATPETVRDFSGTAWFFGQRLHAELAVPVGLVAADWGGTPIESWMSAEALGAFPEMSERLARLTAANRQPEKAGAADAHTPTALYNGMIAPLAPFSFTGVIWYQGESNRPRARRYRDHMAALIADWRRQFLRSDMPFYWVQIAPFTYAGDKGETAELRESQAAAQTVPHTGMAVTMDVGNPKDIHPNDKKTVGRRLAALALREHYARQDIVAHGPTYASQVVEGGRIRVTFTCLDGGLKTRDGKAPTCFMIAADNRRFVPAAAVIDGDAVVLTSVDVAAPVAVRFAWGADDEPNLANGAGFPAGPFRSDDWPGVTPVLEPIRPADNKPR